MSCEVLTPERLEALLAGSLDEASKELLSTHLSVPCEPCLDRLSSVEGTAILRALAGSAAKLEPAEADRMFEAARRAAVWSRGRRYVPMALAAGLLLFVAVRPSFVLDELESPRVEPTGRLKGANDSARPTISLMGLRGYLADGRPAAGARLDAGDRLEHGERVLFRFRINRPAFVYWWVEHADGVELLHAPKEGSAATAAGEHELAEEGQVLALDPGPYTPRLRVIVLACASPRAMASITRALTDEASAASCGRDALEFEVGAK